MGFDEYELQLNLWDNIYWTLNKCDLTIIQDLVKLFSSKNTSLFLIKYKVSILLI